MKAIRLNGFEGRKSMELTDVKPPKPGAGQILIEVKAAGINFAELELIAGRYSVGKQPPFVMGFEAAGIVSETGAGVTHLRAGDRVTSIVTSGAYAEYAVAEAHHSVHSKSCQVHKW
jgi:NADPH:quinone reductase